MWTIFRPAPNIHVDRLVHMVHMPKSQPCDEDVNAREDDTVIDLTI